jgi:hypothetical protein
MGRTRDAIEELERRFDILTHDVQRTNRLITLLIKRIDEAAHAKNPEAQSFREEYLQNKKLSDEAVLARVSAGPEDSADNDIDERPVKLWELWSEGYSATGQSSRATFHGEVYATSFLEACRKRFKRDDYYDERNGCPTYWGCRLFDNQAEARRAFG